MKLTTFLLFFVQSQFYNKLSKSDRLLDLANNFTRGIEKAKKQLGLVLDSEPLNKCFSIFLSWIFPGLGQLFDFSDLIVDNIRKQRIRQFFEDIKDSEINKEMVESNDFIHAFLCTAKAALHTRRNEKITLLAQLFKNYTKTYPFIPHKQSLTDSYEEYLSILDDLSYREVCLLMLIKEFEDKNPHYYFTDINDNGKEEEKREKICRKEFRSKAKALLELTDESEVIGFLMRLERTGLYATRTLAIGDPCEGYLTPNFKLFLQALGKVRVEIPNQNS